MFEKFRFLKIILPLPLNEIIVIVYFKLEVA